MNALEETLRNIGVAFIGMAVAICVMGLGVTEPPVAKRYEKIVEISSRSVRWVNATISSLKIWITDPRHPSTTAAILIEPRDTF